MQNRIQIEEENRMRVESEMHSENTRISRALEDSELRIAQEKQALENAYRESEEVQARMRVQIEQSLLANENLQIQQAQMYAQLHEQQTVINSNIDMINRLEDMLHDMEVIRDYPVPNYLNMDYTNDGILGLAGSGKSTLINGLLE